MFFFFWIKGTILSDESNYRFGSPSILVNTRSFYFSIEPHCNRRIKFDHSCAVLRPQIHLSSYKDTFHSSYPALFFSPFLSPCFVVNRMEKGWQTRHCHYYSKCLDNCCITFTFWSMCIYLDHLFWNFMAFWHLHNDSISLFVAEHVIKLRRQI